MPKYSVLFVCLGNICRSPMAEMVMRQLVIAKGVEQDWEIDSAGTASYHIGDLPDKRTISVCKQNFPGLVVKHRGRQVSEDDFLHYDYIFAMDLNNLEDLKEIKPPKSKAILKLLGDYDPNKERIVKDPYYGGIEGFEHIFKQITRCCEAFYSSISSKEDKD